MHNNLEHHAQQHWPSLLTYVPRLVEKSPNPQRQRKDEASAGEENKTEKINGQIRAERVKHDKQE